MKKTTIDISLDEKNRILEMYKSNTTIISEALGGGANTTERPAQTTFTTTEVKKLGTNLFKTGSSEINKESNEFKNAVNNLKKLTTSDKVEVQGGASLVGQKSGYDNMALANRRARNFVKALIESGVNKNFVIIKSVVGGSDVRDSKEALAAQFVKYGYDNTNINPNTTTAIDNTATVVPPNLGDVSMQPRDTYKIYYEVVYNPKLNQKESIITSAITDVLEDKAISVRRLTRQSLLGL
jgi:hypothetical protein